MRVYGMAHVTSSSSQRNWLLALFWLVALTGFTIAFIASLFPPSFWGWFTPLLALTVSGPLALGLNPHILDREPSREFVDGEAGEARRGVDGLDLELSGLVRRSTRVCTRVLREDHPWRAFSTATAASSEDKHSKRDRSKTTL
jgi:hypothetical protein